MNSMKYLFKEKAPQHNSLYHPLCGSECVFSSHSLRFCFVVVGGVIVLFCFLIDA